MTENTKNILIKRTWSSLSEDARIHSGDVIGSDSVLSAQPQSALRPHVSQDSSQRIARPPLVSTSPTVQFLRFTLPDVAYVAAGVVRSAIRGLTHSLFDSPTAAGSPTGGA
jgi:hypothetical protein